MLRIHYVFNYGVKMLYKDPDPNIFLHEITLNAPKQGEKRKPHISKQLHRLNLSVSLLLFREMVWDEEDEF